MEKIINYIKQGKGLGFLFLLATSVLMTIFIMLACKQVYSQLYPQFMSAADEILPITVYNGKIVSPEDTYKRIDIKLGMIDGKSKGFPVVLDTRSDNVDMPQEELGLFIMRDVVYVFMKDQVQRIPLQNGELNKSMFEEQLNYLQEIMPLVVSALLVVLFFCVSLIKVLILVFIALIMLKLKKSERVLTVDVLMRLSAIAIAFIEIIWFLLNCLGFPLLWFYQFIIALLLIWGFICKELKNV